MRLGAWTSGETIPADALLGLAFSQAINSFRSFAGYGFPCKKNNGLVTSGEIGSKSFNTSYGSE